MGGVRAALAVEVNRRVPRVVRRLCWWGLILTAEALEAGRRLNQRAVYRKVRVGQQPAPVGLDNHLVEELLSHLVLEQPLAILGEGARVEARFKQVHVEEPAVQQVVLQFLAEGPFAPYGVE